MRFTMKYYPLLYLLFLFVSCSPLKTPRIKRALATGMSNSFELEHNDRTDELSCLFEKVLIAGASVSSSSTPTAKYLTKHYGFSVVQNLAVPGSRSAKQIESIEDFLDQEIKVKTLIATDLYFWDSTLKSDTKCDGVIKKMDTLFSIAAKNDLFLILSNVPKIRSPFVRLRSCRKNINNALKKNCLITKNCLLVDTESLIENVYNDNSYTHKGVTYERSRIFKADKIHFTSLAQKILSDIILESLEKTDIVCE